MSRKGFDLDHLGLGTVTLVLVNGYVLTGTIVQHVRHHHDTPDFPPIEAEVHVLGEVHAEVEPEFLLLTLTAPYPATGTAIFPVGTVVAVNEELILFAGPVQV